MAKDTFLRDRIVCFLLDHHEEEFESFELAKKLGAAKGTINSYLSELEAEMVIERIKTSYYSRWRINRMRVLARIMITNLWTPALFGIDFQFENQDNIISPPGDSDSLTSPQLSSSSYHREA